MSGSWARWAGGSIRRRMAGLGLLTLGCGQAAPPESSCRSQQRAAIVGGSADPGALALDEVEQFTAESVSRRIFRRFDGIVGADDARTATAGAA